MIQVPEATQPVRPAPRAWIAAASAMLACLAGGIAHAQVLLQPVVLELSPRQRSVIVSVSLSDKAVAPIRLQAELLLWRQDIQGKAVTEPNDDLLISPSIADLKPGQRQVFRVAVRNPRPLPQEATYRLILEDIAEAPVDEAGKPLPGISIRMRYDMPVMVAAAGKPIQSVRWKRCASTAATRGPAEACVRVRNTGNRRIKVQSLQLAGDGWLQSLAIADRGTLLAGSEREWRVPLGGASGGSLRDVQVLTARGDRLQAEPGDF